MCWVRRRQQHLDPQYLDNRWDHREPIQGCRADHFLKESSEEIISTIMQRLFKGVSDDEDVCRICHSGGGTPANPLASPCQCKGSLNLVHVDCLKTWIVTRIERGEGILMVHRCEVCNGWLDPKAINILELYEEYLLKMFANCKRYQVELRTLGLNGPARPSRFQRFIRRIRRWMTS